VPLMPNSPLLAACSDDQAHRTARACAVSFGASGRREVSRGSPRQQFPMSKKARESGPKCTDLLRCEAYSGGARHIFMSAYFQENPRPGCAPALDGVFRASVSFSRMRTPVSAHSPGVIFCAWNKGPTRGLKMGLIGREYFR
jgi:hypothetical protein